MSVKTRDLALCNTIVHNKHSLLVVLYAVWDEGHFKFHSVDCQWLQYFRAPEFVQDVGVTFIGKSIMQTGSLWGTTHFLKNRWVRTSRRSSSVSLRAMISDSL